MPSSYNEKEAIVELIERLVQIIDETIKDDIDEKSDIGLTEEKEAVRLRVPGAILFDLGEAIIKPESLPFLDKLSNVMKEFPFTIAVEGHTDDLPINTIYFHSNWDLSSIRAASVINYFIETKNLEPKRFKVTGYADTIPLAPNTTPENRAKNRRVEFLFIKGTLISSYPVLQPGDIAEDVLTTDTQPEED